MTNTDAKCDNCGQTLDSDAAICPECGYRLARDPHTAGEGDIYLMLLTANVLRLRREWELAEAKCSEVLQRDPKNGAACSVMGDIARDQGRLRDAIEWYKLALDRNPGGTIERKKLEALIDQVFATPPKGAVKKCWSALLRGFRTAVAEVRSARPHGPMGLVVVTVLGVILLVAISAVWIGPRAGSAPTPGPHPGGEPFAIPVTATRQMAPPEQPRPSAVKAPADLVAREPELLAHLQAAAKRLDPNFEVIDAEINPLNSTIAVHVAMPRVWSPKKTMRESILRMFVDLAGDVVTWDGRVVGVRERCDLRGPRGADQPAAFAESTRDEVEKLRQAKAADVEKLFGSVWWAPELKE